MILEAEKITVPTLGRDKVEFLINWTTAVNNCEYVKMQINGNRGILIPKGVFLKLAFMLANEEEQDSLIPTKSIPIKQFRKEFTIKVLEDLKAGESIKFVGTFDVPVTSDTLPILSNLNPMAKIN